MRPKGGQSKEEIFARNGGVSWGCSAIRTVPFISAYNEDISSVFDTNLYTSSSLGP